ncbi:MAG: hypothetical protein Q9203_003514 [Teloschistes exilis]
MKLIKCAQVHLHCVSADLQSPETNVQTPWLKVYSCWIVVFSPQIIEIFRRGAADGLSLNFIIIWLLGDVFNVAGAILQDVIPTMKALAVYHTLADIVLLGQCFYYRGFTLSDAQAMADEEATIDEEAGEESPLLRQDSTTTKTTKPITAADADRPRRSSSFSFHVDASHLSPATPFVVPPNSTADLPVVSSQTSKSVLRTTIFNVTALVLVCAVGVLGWFLSTRASHHDNSNDGQDDLPILPPDGEKIHFDLWGQIFGYLCAALYTGSRLPQLLLNYRRQSTEGISMLFFIFACAGNVTFVMSIFAFEPDCVELGREYAALQCQDGEWSAEYGKYILVNTSWVIGSAGALVLDLLIFVQFWIYSKKSGK